MQDLIKCQISLDLRIEREFIESQLNREEIPYILKENPVGESTQLWTFIGKRSLTYEFSKKLLIRAYEIMEQSTIAGTASNFLGPVYFEPLGKGKNMMTDCVELARRLGKTISSQLNDIPTILDGKAVKENNAPVYYDRRFFSIDQDWTPDYGDKSNFTEMGLLMIGARPLSVKYNLNLTSSSFEIAQEIAERIGDNGRLVKIGEENYYNLAGSLENVFTQAASTSENKFTQVITEILDYEGTPIYEVFKEVKKEAEEFGVGVTGGELLGVVPKEALISVGKYWREKKNYPEVLDEDKLLKNAINYLNLNDQGFFRIDKKLIEYILEED